MSTKKVLLIVFTSNLLLVAMLAGLLYFTDTAFANPATALAESTANINAHDPDLFPTVPQKMSYQGILRDTSGNAINGTHDLTFAIFSCEPFCFDLWTETHDDVTLKDGLFNVVLGETTPLDAGIFSGYSYYQFAGNQWGEKLFLSVKVDGGETLTPSPELITVPYAFRAEYVNRFPAPHYDSGWVNTSVGCQVLDHNLGGNSENYIVDMQMKDTSSGFAYGVHQFAYGQYYDDTVGSYGVSWSWLTNAHIRICRGTDDVYSGQVRVRIWRTD
jgi:hypothetical protein